MCRYRQSAFYVRFFDYFLTFSPTEFATSTVNADIASRRSCAQAHAASSVQIIRHFADPRRVAGRAINFANSQSNTLLTSTGGALLVNVPNPGVDFALSQRLEPPRSRIRI
ncbi:hypothetical protein BYT27DRAFT_7215030 [Phlegmacium glaucopus]|nr:hypothetical protein BYT27DRAFT_7215030 [Phlegmacium glaucopus]